MCRVSSTAMLCGSMEWPELSCHDRPSFVQLCARLLETGMVLGGACTPALSRSQLLLPSLPSLDACHNFYCIMPLCSIGNLRLASSAWLAS